MQIRVWLSGDGYRDPDDNLALLIGAAEARVAAKSGNAVKVAGVVFGDTKDGGQYYMLNPFGTAPESFGSDSRYGSVPGNKQAAGNYAFFSKYTVPAIEELAPGWDIFNLLAGDQKGLRAWNFDATSATQITAAARALAGDIVAAIGKTGGAREAAELVVYSAGGGANVAAEAIGYLRNQGYSEEVLRAHFAVVQHGNNWVTNYEAAARILTRDFTVAISNQNYATYANGSDGPDLKHALAGPTAETAFGPAFDRAIAVATGAADFENLGAGKTFKTTLDASDSGSHAFAVAVDRLVAALDDRLSGIEEMREDYDWAHLIDTGSGTRLREIFADFDPAAVAALLGAGVASANAPGDSSGGSSGGSSRGAAPETGGILTAAVAASRDDAESRGGLASDDLDFGTTDVGGRTVANTVALRFTGLDLDAGAEIEHAYLLFEAKRAGPAAGTLPIAIEDTRDAARFAAGETLAARDVLDDTVTWSPGAWSKGKTYASADIADLIEAVIGDGGLDALDALAFRITGTGSHSAHAFDSAGAAPVLVIEHA
jgi:hypothetical protein